MDKKNSEVRKYIAQRAELLGAIRLPNNTFTKNAGTKVTSDILFLKKRGNGYFFIFPLGIDTFSVIMQLTLKVRGDNHVRPGPSGADLLSDRRKPSCTALS